MSQQPQQSRSKLIFGWLLMTKSLFFPLLYKKYFIRTYSYMYIHSTHTFPRNSIFPIHDFTSLLQFLPPSLAFPYLGIVNRPRMLLIMWNFSTISHYQTHVLIAPFRSKNLSKTSRRIYVLTFVSKLLYLPNLQRGGAAF